MKKAIATAVLIYMMGTAAFAGNRVIKFGVYEPLSGNSSSAGKQEVLGITYAHSKTPPLLR